MAVTLELLRRLNEQQVEFVLIGGLAANLHGVQRVTEDIDVCIPFTVENMKQVIAALGGVNPHYRMRPDLPFKTDPQYYADFKNLYLVTDVGPIDFLGEVEGVGRYEQAVSDSQIAEVQGMKFRVLTIEALIRAKRAAGRQKDWEAIRQLEALQRARDEQK
jgi:predicted nucleotidyltransferase